MALCVFNLFFFVKKGIFGHQQAMVHTIEFQKRGLPHAHILVILKSESKLRSVDDYDMVVSAQLPVLRAKHSVTSFVGLPETRAFQWCNSWWI